MVSLTEGYQWKDSPFLPGKAQNWPSFHTLPIPECRDGGLTVNAHIPFSLKIRFLLVTQLLQHIRSILHVDSVQPMVDKQEGHAGPPEGPFRAWTKSSSVLPAPSWSRGSCPGPALRTGLQ